MTLQEKIISEILSAEEYIELQDEIAIGIFNILFGNKNIIDNLKNNYIFISTNDKKINTKIINWNIDEFETDISDAIDNSLNFRGSCNAIGFDDPLMLVINVRDFNIYEIIAVDMNDNTEVVFIEQGKYVKKMERETFQSGPRTYGNRYKYTYRGNV